VAGAVSDCRRARAGRQRAAQQMAQRDGQLGRRLITFLRPFRHQLADDVDDCLRHILPNLCDRRRLLRPMTQQIAQGVASPAKGRLAPSTEVKRAAQAVEVRAMSAKWESMACSGAKIIHGPHHTPSWVSVEASSSVSWPMRAQPMSRSLMTRNRSPAYRATKNFPCRRPWSEMSARGSNCAA